MNRNYITKVGSNSVLCQLELPGYYKDDIDIILDKENRELKISADRDDPFFGKFSESYVLDIGNMCDLDKCINYSLDMGILSIKFAKRVNKSKTSR